MNYSGNMPDWHQYNPPQAGRTSAPSVAQNANPGHMFISGVGSPALDGINLSSDRHRTNKHQNEAPFVGRNYQGGAIATGSNCPTSSALTSGVHMTPLTPCVGHYGPSSSRNTMMDGLPSSMDPRMNVGGINDDVAHRNSQMNFPGSSNHLNATNINVNTNPGVHGSAVGQQNSPVGSISPGRQGPGFGACKGPCCNPDANIPYQHWDKYGHYPGTPNATNSYRDNIRQPAYQPIDNRRFLPEMNLRKDCHDNKDIVDPTSFPVEHRRNFTDYKYARKESVISRNYPTNPNNLLPNYPIQNYNFPNEYQKCPYSVKDYMRRGGNPAGTSINTKNSGILKYQEQQSIIVQQKYQHSKQMQYQNGGVLPSGLANPNNNGNLPSPLQNSYFNPGQIPRDLSRDYSHDYQQDPAVVSNRIPQTSPSSHVHGSFQKYHAYQQKIAMQRYSLENHLRAFTRIPNYQSHPKYQECVMRYRELLRLQQTVDYQNVLQEAPKVPSPANGGAVAPINLQFDQNGILINSNYIPSNYSGIHNNMNPITNSENRESTENNRTVGSTNPMNLETQNQFIDHGEQIHQNSVTSIHENQDRYFMHDEKNDDSRHFRVERIGTTENLDSTDVDVDRIETTKTLEEIASTTTNSTTIPTATTTTCSTIQYKNSKDFADKPELDVRQFLANWDESEDEDATTTNVSNVESNDSTTNLTGQFEGTVFSTKSPENKETLDQPTNSTEETNLNSENKEKKSSETTNVENRLSSEESASDSPDTLTNQSLNKNCSDEIQTSPKEIRCIRTDDGTDDIPTIHIVDNLEPGSEMEKIHTVFGSLTSAVLNQSSIGESTEIVCEEMGKGERIVLFEQEENGVCTKTLEFNVAPEENNSEAVEGVITSIIEATPVNSTERNNAEPENSYKSPESSSYISSENSYKSPESTENTENPSNSKSLEETPKTVAISSSESDFSSVTTISVVASSSCSSKSNVESVGMTNLRKQNSFTSDESHNPDDISLPDLQTSECTPISTTLNTPIHSDSEESSEHVSDLTISTNPIEIIQNSPIISFTHSPIKIEPYEQLDHARTHVRESRQREHDSLDFDFDREVALNENTTKYTENSENSPDINVDVELEAGNSILLGEIEGSTTNRERYDEKSNQDSQRDDEFYRTADPLVGMAHISESVSKEEKILKNSSGDTENCTTENGTEENDASRCDLSVDGILRSDELDTDKCSSLMERDDDFHRSEDLEKLCDMSLDDSCMIPLIAGEENEEPIMPVPPMEGNCLTKILNDTLPITDIDVLESSDEEKLGKSDEDIWVEVRFQDLEENSTGQKVKNSASTSESKKSKNILKCPKIFEKNEKYEKHEKTSRKKSKHHNDQKNQVTSQSEVNVKSCVLGDNEVQERIEVSEGAKKIITSENCERDNSLTSSMETVKLAERPKEQETEEFQVAEETKKSRDCCKRRFSHEEREIEENFRESAESDENDGKHRAKSFLTTRRDSNVEIQVANFNVKIHDNEVIRTDSICSKTKNQDSATDSVDAIEIKINLSRGDNGRRNNKLLQDKTTIEQLDLSEKKLQTASCQSGKMCCRRRRRSMLDECERKKYRKSDENKKEEVLDNCTKKISKSKNNSATRRKIRKSMDDELLLHQERTRKEVVIDERNFPSQILKNFNIPWTLEEDAETNEFRSSIDQKDDESKRNKQSTSTKIKDNSRMNSEKHGKEARKMPSPSYSSAFENSSTLDFDNFDVAPNETSETEQDEENSASDNRYREKTRHEDRERYRKSTNYGTSCDELASLDAFEINLNTVPVYTTKDGRITYSPNRNYTYRALIMEARQREGYPSLRKLHYPRNLLRNYNRESLRKLYNKRRQIVEDRSSHEKKQRRGVDYHSGKSKRSSSNRQRLEETETRIVRSKKHENRRRETTRIPSEMEYCSDDQSRGYVDDTLTTNNPRIGETVPILTFKTDSRKNNQEEIDQDVRRSEGTRIDERVDTCTRNNNAIDDSLTNSKCFSGRENDLVSKIFHGQELEISTRKIVAVCPERSENQRNRFFHDSSRFTKIPIASPTINIDKRPIGWDIEQDFQTVLSDSGLESSTTCVEATKDSRRIQRWKNSFVNKVETTELFYAATTNKYVEAIEPSLDKSNVDETLRYFDRESKCYENLKNRPGNEIVQIEQVEKEIVKADCSKKIIDVVIEDSEKIDKSVDNGKIEILEKTWSISTIETKALKDNEISEIVRGLDLAIIPRIRGSLKESQLNLEQEKEKHTTQDKNRDCNKPETIFHKNSIPTNFDGADKIFPASFRRASSDAFENSDFRNISFENSKITKIIETIESKEIPENETEIFDEKHDEKFDNSNVASIIDETMDRTEIGKNFHAQNSCKDFLIDSSTSFSSCMKLQVPDPVSELPESETSRLDDTLTSTRFPSESMDFKQLGDDGNALVGNFSSFANCGIVNSSVIDPETPVRNFQDSFFSRIDEDSAMENISKKIVKSEEEKRTEESPCKKQILSFSGQIQNDKSPINSTSESSTSRANENIVTKIMIKKNETVSKTSSSTITQPLESETRENHDFEKKEIQVHPKIPKMIIRNVRSRPGTPTAIDEIEAEIPLTKNSVKDQKVFQVEIKRDKKDLKRDSPIEGKIPKMKIKLEDNQMPRMITENIKERIYENIADTSKNVPRVKLKKVQRSSTSQSPVRGDKVSLVGKLSRQSSETQTQMDFIDNADNSNTSNSYKFTLIDKSSKYQNSSGKVDKIDENTKQDRIPKLTIKKQEVGSNSGYSSSQSSKKRRSRSPGESGSKKQRKGTNKHYKKEESRSQEKRIITDSVDDTNDSHQSLSEKIPKVIIKRTSPSAEFKCELSKGGREAITKDSKWQPEVKLQRFWVLDYMAMEPGNGKLALKMLETSSEIGEKEISEIRKNNDWKENSSDINRRRDSLSFGGKIRRKSDCDLNKVRCYYENDKETIVRNNRRKSFDESLNSNRKVPFDNVSSTKHTSLPAKVKREINDTEESTKNTETRENVDDKKKSKIIEGDSKNSTNSRKSEKNSAGNSTGNFDESSVIKLDSSDESQTTIEILPASPDTSQPESDILERVLEIENNVENMGKLYSDDAIPTQFELELEIVDNSTVDSLDVPMPILDESGIDNLDESLEEDSTSTLENSIHRSEHFKSHSVTDDDDDDNGDDDNEGDESPAMKVRSKNVVYQNESKKCWSKNDESGEFFVETDMKNICCSDSLVKEVLAAKETLKRCLTKSKNDIKPKSKPRPKTAAEKKQGSGFDFVGLSGFSKKSKRDVEERGVFHNSSKSLKNTEIVCRTDKTKSETVEDKRQSRPEKSHRSVEKHEKYRKSWMNDTRQQGYSKNDAISLSTIAKNSKRSSLPATNVTKINRGKSIDNENFGENSRTKSSDLSSRSEKSLTSKSSKSTEKPTEPQVNLSKGTIVDDSTNKMKSYKIPKISRSGERKISETKVTDETRKSPSDVKMPVLEPQIDLNFELTGSDRDTSRSPPVITKQEEPEIDSEIPKKIDEKIDSDNLESITKQQDSEAVTFADIVSQLAYHEKATIRHRRYCTLCERWFPTAARHRRHLTGYQHRHTELTQRRTVHALFMLFTGKPCPRLLPASIVRTDCLPGEPTPLQIAVQDVAISLEDGAREKPSKDVSDKNE